MPDLLLAASLAASLGGMFAENLGLSGSLGLPDLPGPLGALRLEAGVGYTRYLSAVAALRGDLPLGSAPNAPRLVLAAGYALDSDAAGDARTTLHSLYLRVGLEAPLSDHLFVAAEVVPVRFPLRLTASRNGSSHAVPVDATDALFLQPGVGLGWRFP